MPIKFQDPPATDRRPRRGGAGAKIAAELRARPGEWALVYEGVNTRANGPLIKEARVSAFAPAGSFEAVTRGRPDGKFDIYARFVGEVA